MKFRISLNQSVVGVISTLALLATPLYAAEVEEVRVWRAPDHTRLVFDLSERVDFNLFTLANPDRIVIDIENSSLTGSLAGLELSDTPITGIRSGTREGNTLRIVLDINSAVEPSGFSLAPNTELGHRLVVDLYDEVPAVAGARIGSAIRTPVVAEKRDIVIAISAADGSEELYETVLGAMRDAHTPQEQRRFLMALADFSTPRLIDRTLRLALTPEVAIQDVVFLLYRLLENSAATERTWAFTQKRWSSLSRRMPDRLAGRLLAALPLLGTRAYRTEVASFFRDHPLPSSDRLLRQALERFDWWLGFHRGAALELEAYLDL